MNKTEVVSRETKDGNIIVQYKNDAFGVPYLQKEFLDEKSETQFIKKVESQVRSSQEYRSFIHYMKNELGFNHCSFFNKMNTNDITVEIHHHPFTLYDIVETEVTKHIHIKHLFNTFLISFYVMKSHFENLIGLVPLSSTMHEMAHSATGGLTIPSEIVIGNYTEYYTSNSEYMSDRVKNKYLMWVNEVAELTDFEKNSIDPEQFISNEMRTRQIANTNIYGFNEENIKELASSGEVE